MSHINYEKLRLHKLAKLIEHTHLLISSTESNCFLLRKKSINELEKWPLINATGFDVLGEGFFKLKHSIIDISDE